MISRLNGKTDPKLPKPYSKLLARVSAPSSVAGLLQPTSSEPLIILEQFCLQQINIRESINASKCKLLTSQLPALWPICVEICETENTLFLPQDVSNIVIKLLEIRRSTFANAPMLEDYMIMIIIKYFIEKKIFFYFSDLHHFGGNEYFKVISSFFGKI